MGGKKNITDRVFRDSLGNYQESPPESVWAGIEGTLANDRRKSRMAWIGRIAAAAVILIAAGTIWILFQRTPETGVVSTGPLTEPAQQESAQQESAQPEPADEAANTESPAPSVPGPGDAASGDSPGVTDQEPGQIASQETDPSAGSGAQTLAMHTLEPAAEPGVLTPDAQPPGAEKPEGIIVTGQPGQDLQQIPGGLYTIPVSSPEPGLIIADRSAGEDPEATELTETGEGIDVFEEFGEGSEDYNRWAVGGQMAPLYSYRNISSSQGNALYTAQRQSSQSYNDIENGIVSYSGGVNLNYSPVKRLSLQSGLYYSRLGMTVQNTWIAASGGQYERVNFPSLEVAMSNSSGDIQAGGEKSNTVLANAWSTNEILSDASGAVAGDATTETKKGDLLQHFDYIEVPMILRYKVVDRRLGFNLLGGISTNFLVGSNVYFEENGDKELIGSTSDLKQVNYSSVLGMGLQYSISRRLNLMMEPVFRYYLNSINEGSIIDSHPYSLGFFTGISYSF